MNTPTKPLSSYPEDRERLLGLAEKVLEGEVDHTDAVNLATLVQDTLEDEEISDLVPDDPKVFDADAVTFPSVTTLFPSVTTLSFRGTVWGVYTTYANAEAERERISDAYKVRTENHLFTLNTYLLDR